MTNKCVLPFINQDYQFNSPCCQLKGFNAERDTEQLLEDHRNNRRSNFCSDCWKTEDSGLISKRQKDNKLYENHLLLNKRRYKVNSDWKEYYGSSDNLTIDIKRLGKDNFKREILFYCKSKAELSYIEAREQFARKVLESNDYYNGHIRVRIHGSGILREKTTKGILKEKAST